MKYSIIFWVILGINLHSFVFGGVTTDDFESYTTTSELRNYWKYNPGWTEAFLETEDGANETAQSMTLVFDDIKITGINLMNPYQIFLLW